MLQGAMQAAISSCGVGVIGLPGDLAAENATAGLSSTFSFPTRQRVCPAEQEIRELADLLNNAKKVTLYCGIGAKDAHPELVQLAKYESSGKSPFCRRCPGERREDTARVRDLGRRRA